jgi:hypothetical protein
MNTYKRLHAYVVESNDGSEEWFIHAIAWTIGEAAIKAREIPWRWRIRRVVLNDDGVVNQPDVLLELEKMEKLEEICSKI